MSDETKQRERRDAPTVAQDAVDDAVEALGQLAYRLSKRDKAWLTPEVIANLRRGLNNIVNAANMVDATLDNLLPQRGLSISAGGELPREPGGLLKQALAGEEQQAAG